MSSDLAPTQVSSPPPDRSRLADWLFAHPRKILTAIVLVTAFFAVQIPGLKMYTEFSDLLPQEHPYIVLHNEVRELFGGANTIVISVSVDEGTIFDNEVLSLVYELTLAVDSLPGINHNLVSGLTHRGTRSIKLQESGDIRSRPYYDPEQRNLTAEQLAQMRDNVVGDPRVYGILVSPDLRSTLIKGQLHEGGLDYRATFAELTRVRDLLAKDGVHIYATGHPVLVGWVYTFLSQIIQILIYTAVIMLVILLFYFRRPIGVLLPLTGILLSSVWGLGVVSLLGFNLDPLGLVIPFLISARGLSHGIQLVSRFNLELERHPPPVAAKAVFTSLFRPGSLGVYSDAIGLSVITLGSIPINTKLGIYSAIWALGIIITVLVTIPLLLSILRKPAKPPARTARFRLHMTMTPQRSRALLIAALVAVIVGGYPSSKVTIGESDPGSPLLYSDHDYNVSSMRINEAFPGSEEMYIIARADKPGGLKRPEVLQAIEDLQVHMMYDPGVGGTRSLADLVKQMNQLIHSDDPRWGHIPATAPYTGGLLFAFMASSPMQGALKEYVNPEETQTNIAVFYKDHQGTTIRRSIHLAKSWIDSFGNKVPGLSFHLAGGTIGVNAAINEAAYETNLIVVPLVLGLIFIFVSVFYRAAHAGWLMLLAMSFATALTYAFMGISGIGVNVNTVPIIAVGIGMGIDYSIYIVDRIREEVRHGANLVDGVNRAIETTGVAVLRTAFTLMAGVLMWLFVSDLRYQADAAKLLSVMLGLNVIAAIFIVPAWITIFRPKFLAIQSPGPPVRNEEGH